eukprot:scaffold269514_cov28-Tisochrysis_lutea.AAC.1
MDKMLQDVLKAPRRNGHRIGPDIVLLHQVPNSPDTNACDLRLGYLQSMDSRLPTFRSCNLDKFTQECEQAFHEYPPQK